MTLPIADPWITGIALVLFGTIIANPTAAQDRPKYVIALHGGAGGEQISPERREAKLADLRRALTAGRDILAEGGKALDAVERVINVLEDSPVFNAGKGSVLNTAGKCELDSSIMDGSDLSAGAVAGVTVVKNPISLARRVMADTPHVLLAGRGAEEFARQAGLEIVEPEYFQTKFERAKWEASEAKRKAGEDPQARSEGKPLHLGTVGCVVLDSYGNLAAGTSTGGTYYKLPGRIGDSPIIGAGTYADNRGAAISCTGIGELFIQRAIAYDLSSAVRYQRCSLAEAARQQLHEELPKNSGGLVAIDHKGNVVVDYNTPGMAGGVADASGRFEVFLDKTDKN
jgi:isoaspartyl peptidase/L-asparaginase-like protein (Ntn-hydrolase superfamily)